MSKQLAIEFFKTVKSDEELQEKLRAADSPASIVKAAAENGYEFTEQELHAVMQESRSGDGELSEEDLATVAGGVCFIGTTTWGLGCSSC